jgi:hypothetical protein
MSSSVSAASAYPLADEFPKTGVRVIQIVAVVALAMGLYFWVDSRYPALLKKLHAGKSVKVTAAITFDAVLPVNASMSLPARIVRTSATGCGPIALA